MTDSTQVFKPNATEQVMHALAIALAGAGLIAAGWFGNALWQQNAFEAREAQFEAREVQLDAYEIELQQWATQAANTEFAAKRQALIDELYNQSCVVPPGTFQLGNAATFQLGSERTGVLIDGTCYVPTSSGYTVENQVRAQIPAPPEP
jgi:hypothetical protein